MARDKDDKEGDEDGCYEKEYVSPNNTYNPDSTWNGYWSRRILTEEVGREVERGCEVLSR